MNLSESWLRLDIAMDQAYSLPHDPIRPKSLEGKVVEIQFGGVRAHVVMRVGKNLMESVITKRSADEMKLKGGGQDFNGDQVH